MTDPVQLPPSLPGQTRPAATPEEESNTQIVSLPPGLDVRDIVRLRGEVVQVTAENVVRIITEKGEVEIRLDPGEPVPAKGDTVTVEIQPGRPPTAKLTVEEPVTPPPRSVETPVDVQVRPPNNVPDEPVPPSGPLPETPVRLEPIPYEQAQQYVEEPLETILTAIQERIVFQTEITAAQIQQTVITPAVTSLPAKPAQTFPPLAQVVFPDIKPIKSEPGAVFVKPQPLPANIPADSFIPKLNFPLTLPQTGETLPGQPPVAQIMPEPFQIQTPVADILKPGIFSIPAIALQTFTARVAAIQVPPAQVSDIPNTIIPKLKTMITTSPEPLILKNQKAGTVMATVIGHTPQKLPLIAFFSPEESVLTPEKASFFILHTPAPDLVPGTEITLQPQEGGKMILSAPNVAPAPLALMTPEPWPLMDEIYEALAQAMPQAAQAFSNTLPSPARPEQLGPAALFFLAAVRGGDLTQWLGDRAADVIRRAGRNGLLSRLSLEGASLNRLSSEPVSQDWRGVSLPLFWDNEIHKLALYFRQDDQTGGGREDGKQVRFIFDLNLDHMGKVQLDGLFRPRRLDLIVRSEQALSSAMQMQMRRAYISALEPTEVRGELSFQNKPEQWVTIKPELQKFGTSA